MAKRLENQTKLAIIKDIKEGKLSPLLIAEKHGVSRSYVYFLTKAHTTGDRQFSDAQKLSRLKSRKADLEAEIREINILIKSLERGS